MQIWEKTKQNKTKQNKKIKQNKTKQKTDPFFKMLGWSEKGKQTSFFNTANLIFPFANNYRQTYNAPREVILVLY